MLNVLRSRATAASRQFEESPRQDGEDNLAWLARSGLGDSDGDGVWVVLLGGRDRIAFRLRTAQSRIRDDLTPSHWSHVALMDQMAKDLGRSTLHEISLDPQGGFGFPTPTNAVQKGTLRRYRSAEDFPNIAVVRVPVERKRVLDALRQFQGQRTVLDATELVIVWLAYLWGAGRAGNPLLESQGIPSAAMLEMVLGAADYDITPGLESRSSCPEAIWQAAKWWHAFYESKSMSPPEGAWSVEHRL